MITLYGSGPNFGLPDASPFVTKAETLLRMSKLPFEKALMSFSKAPKGKIPYIEDDGQLLGDSTLIRWHLEKKYGIDFDRASPPSNSPSPGRSRKWRRIICIGPASISAG